MEKIAHFKSTRCQQLKRYSENGAKDSERMCCDIYTSSLNSFVRDKGNKCTFPLEYKGRRLSDSRSFADPADCHTGCWIENGHQGVIAVNTAFPSGSERLFQNII
ncbi:hypothetical protein AVEN_186025-1 [Araneus ventricosus]|uniref:Uncharacterized protein n=1 Tax=Araneus ventricosus TaxID=182803 RepID=A0A4Y2JC98_ARAVE|nr:hypothetical protein AVEN_186025-1 [Araneus ventricosus]